MQFTQPMISTPVHATGVFNYEAYGDAYKTSIMEKI
jgi:hypothetical protein